MIDTTLRSGSNNGHMYQGLVIGATFLDGIKLKRSKPIEKKITLRVKIHFSL